jgi:hypothetical protein
MIARCIRKGILFQQTESELSQKGKSIQNQNDQ